jgi:hypothetical protein
MPSPGHPSASSYMNPQIKHIYRFIAILVASTLARRK